MEYAAIIWSLHKKKHIKKLERIQRMATKMVPELEERTCKERLEEKNLPTLEERREKDDLIAVYKLLNGMDKTDMNILSKEEVAYTRGHKKKLKKGRCLNNTKKYSFPHKSIDAWNSLKEGVIEVNSVHKLK